MWSPTDGDWAKHSGHGNKKKHFILILRANHLHSTDKKDILHKLLWSVIQGLPTHEEQKQFRKVGYSSQYRMHSNDLNKEVSNVLIKFTVDTKLVRMDNIQNQVQNDLDRWKKIAFKAE